MNGIVVVSFDKSQDYLVHISAKLLRLISNLFITTSTPDGWFKLKAQENLFEEEGELPGEGELDDLTKNYLTF